MPDTDQFSCTVQVFNIYSSIYPIIHPFKYNYLRVNHSLSQPASKAPNKTHLPSIQHTQKEVGCLHSLRYRPHQRSLSQYYTQIFNQTTSQNMIMLHVLSRQYIDAPSLLASIKAQRKSLTCKKSLIASLIILISKVSAKPVSRLKS